MYLRLLQIFFLPVFFLFIQCSSHDYDPDCSLYGEDKCDSEEILIQQSRAAWNILANKKKEKQWPQAAEAYNKAIYTLIERLRCKRMSGKATDDSSLPFVVDSSFTSRVPQGRLYDTVIPADQIKIHRLKESFSVYGLGVPLVGIVNREKAKFVQNQISDAEGVHTLTAVLDFNVKKNQRPILRVIPRLQTDHFQVGRQHHHLAANFSAAIDYLWDLSKVDDVKLAGLFRPSEAFDTMGLFFQEAYDPDKIPVVFTHGLQSSPATFANLTNRLISSPEIRKNYQFWFFGYPTGVSWVLTSEKFREAIHHAREQFDPHHKHKSFDQMVLVGHSMGGLITRYSISEDSWAILKYTLKKSEREQLGPDYFADKTTDHSSDSIYAKLEKQFNFSPLPYASRAVFLATPHRGAEFADNWIARLGIALIELPQNLLEETYRIVTLNKNILLLNPEKLVDDLTSISQLSPENAFIRGLDPLRPPQKMPVHSVIGDRGYGDTPNSSDGIVDYSSSHLTWSTSEKIVPANHSVQEGHETASELYKILIRHAQQHKGKKALKFPVGEPAPVHCTPLNYSWWSSNEFFDPGTSFLPIPR